MNTLEAAKFLYRELPRGEEREMPPYTVLAMVLIVVSVRCKARVLKARYGCAAPENADVYREYSSGGLDRTGK